LAAVARPNRLIADKAYDADSLRNWLKIRRIHLLQHEQFLTRSIAPSIDVATLSSASSAVSRTGDVLRQDTTASPETI
jgi:hypothetical protein